MASKSEKAFLDRRWANSTTNDYPISWAEWQACYTALMEFAREREMTVVHIDTDDDEIPCVSLADLESFGKDDDER